MAVPSVPCLLCEFMGIGVWQVHMETYLAHRNRWFQELNHTQKGARQRACWELHHHFTLDLRLPNLRSSY